MSTEERPKPLAEGTFSKTPFAHILVYLMEKKLGGSLVVTDGPGEATIYFREGMPAKVVSSIKGKGLGQVLFDLKRISREQLTECQKEMNASGGFAGEILLRQGAIDGVGLVRGLRGQTLLKIVDVFQMSGGRYAFYENVNLLVGEGPDELFPVDPFPVLMAGARLHGKTMKLDKVLDTAKGRWLSAPPVAALKRFKLTPQEQDLCLDLVSKPRNMEDLIESGKYNLQVVRSVLYVLIITKVVTLGSKPPAADLTSKPPAPKPKLDSIVPPAVSLEESDPQLLALRKAIVSKAEQMTKQNYYEMLEVPLGAPTEEVRKAFFKMAKIYHPDRATASGMEDLLETLQYVFSNLSEAHATLVDPDTREEYGAAISDGMKRTSQMPGPADEDTVRDVLEAEKLYQKGVVLMRRGQNAKALELVDTARRMNPDEGEYLAAWAKLQAASRGADDNLDDLISSMRRALEMTPKSERVNLFMGELLKRAGRPSEALAHFQKVVEINPRNIEAARELRIMRIKREKELEREKKGGFLKRFLKK